MTRGIIFEYKNLRPPKMNLKKLELCYRSLFRVTTLVVLLILALSCAKIPPHVGRSRDVVVVSSVIDTTLVADNLQIYNYVPQKEGLFVFLFASDTAIKDYNRFHTIFLYGSLQDEFIKTLLNPEAEETTQNDSFTLFKLNDLWSKGQLAIILATSKPEYIESGMMKYRNVITKILEDNYYARVKENYYNKALDRKIADALRKFGITFDLGKGWLIDSTYKDEDFIFIHTHFPDRSIFFYKEAHSAELSTLFAIKKRNALTQKYYKGDYILEDLAISESIEFKGMKGIRLKGVWQNDSLVAGGPFLSYLLAQGDTLYMIDGMLFNPGERKSDYFTGLEVTLNSFQLIH